MRDISSNIQTAATAVGQISQNVSEIAGATKAVEQATRQVREASMALAG